MSEQAPAQRTHEEFDPSDGDVTFQSSDNVLFKLHRKNLEVVAGAFPGPEFGADRQIVELQEPAEVLEILFQFAYPGRRPELGDMDERFGVLAQVAEAAEKYQMYIAMDKELAKDYPTPILTHAIKHDYPKLINASALCLCLKPISEVLSKGLPSYYALPWSKYHEDCHSLLVEAVRESRYYYMEKKNKMPQHERHRTCTLATIAWMHHLERQHSLEAIQSVYATLVKTHRSTCPQELCPVLEYAETHLDLAISNVKKKSFADYLKNKD